MPLPTFEVHPLRPAVCSDGPTTLDVLLRLLPVLPENLGDRPPLNLALVLDRSGSMSGSGKLDYARTAAQMLIEQMLPRDRLALTIFDDAVQTLVASTPAVDRPALLAHLPGIQPGGSTALFDGWQEGANQVRPHVDPQALNRVLLLTDGLANVGEVNPDIIGTAVKQASLQGVSTSSLGLGADYNEDLLEAMARSGDGNYYYVQSPEQLPGLFQTELMGLLALVGRQARLFVEPVPGVVLRDVFNDLERDMNGVLILPNLIGGLPVDVVLRFEVEPRAEAGLLARFRVEYESPTDGDQVLTQVLSLPVVAGQDYTQLLAHPEVLERGSLQLMGRLKRQATQHMDREDVEQARAVLRQARELLETLPANERVEQERRDLTDVEQQLEQGDMAGSRKTATYQHYRRSHSK